MAFNSIYLRGNKTAIAAIEQKTCMWDHWFDLTDSHNLFFKNNPRYNDFLIASNSLGMDITYFTMLFVVFSFWTEQAKTFRVLFAFINYGICKEFFQGYVTQLGKIDPTAVAKDVLFSTCHI